MLKGWHSKLSKQVRATASKYIGMALTSIVAEQYSLNFLLCTQKLYVPILHYNIFYADTLCVLIIQCRQGNNIIQLLLNIRQAITKKN